MFDNTLSFVKENIVLFDIIFLFLLFIFLFNVLPKVFFKSDIFFKMGISIIITIILVPKLEPYISDYFRQ